MKKNIGTKDRLSRLAIAVLAGISALFANSTTSMTVLAAISVFTFYEAVAGWCGLYALLGKNTCPISVQEKQRSPETK